MKKEDKILILGSRGLVGSAIVRCLKSDGYSNILTPVREELDLMNQEKVLTYFENNRPDYVVLAAARVGGIYANDTYRADFIHENLVIQSNVFGAAHKFPVQRLLFLGSSCIYPKDCPQPMKEEYLLTGPLEPTNEPYAIAKIAGLKTAESFRRQYGEKFYSVMPTNLYGENDNFHKENSHVIPGLIARMTEAMEKGEKVFKVWGTGKPKREFLYVDDMARGCIHMLNYEGEVPDLVNIGYGTDVTIAELVEVIKEKMGFEGTLEFDTSMPDGTMQKLLDSQKIRDLGWKPEVSLEDGIEKTIKFYRESQA
ncbi:MAG: GDP-fucose synthetase [Halobacteriovorax sp.]|nr:GDP-fucose synthetase [Halobacteriovorax sp.]|tara:strand:- start:29081 stop:30013 length:933 start_codon:yes stop_codon:yes gene_type:complete